MSLEGESLPSAHKLLAITFVCITISVSEGEQLPWDDTWPNKDNIATVVEEAGTLQQSLSLQLYKYYGQSRIHE